MLLKILWKIAGNVFSPNGKQVYWKWPFCVTNAVFFLSSIRKGIAQNAEFMSSVEKYSQFLVFVIKSSISGKGCDCGITILFRSLKLMHNLVFQSSFFSYANVTGAAKGL